MSYLDSFQSLSLPSSPFRSPLWINKLLFELDRYPVSVFVLRDREKCEMVKNLHGDINNTEFKSIEQNIVCLSCQQHKTKINTNAFSEFVR